MLIARIRALLNRWITLLAAKAMLGYLGFTAIGFVLVLVAAEELGLGSSGRGLLVAGYGVGGILLGQYAGSVVDRELVLIYFGIGCASAFVWAELNTIAAVAPLVYVPLFEIDTRAPFLLAAGFTLALALLVLPWFARYPR